MNIYIGYNNELNRGIVYAKDVFSRSNEDSTQ